MKRFVALLFVALALPVAAAPTLFSLEDVLSAPFASESPQWQTTSWTDHFPSPGRHFLASAGTFASAAFNSAGPRS